MSPRRRVKRIASNLGVWVGNFGATTLALFIGDGLIKVKKREMVIDITTSRCCLYVIWTFPCFTCFNIIRSQPKKKIEA